MTAERLLRMNGDMKDPGGSELMDVVRRFHELRRSRGLPYCVVGGMAVIRNGAVRTTADIDVLTLKKEWISLLPLDGEITDRGMDSCIDTRTGITIDILFADDDRGMVIDMPDPRVAGEYDEANGARFLGLHDLVQLKMAVHLSKLKEFGPATAAKDLADDRELIGNNLQRFPSDTFAGYHPAVRVQCTAVFDEVKHSQPRKRPARGYTAE
ncbi:MAG TPA: hypothetical protein VLH81_01975 [Desulfobacterales bacterium]|nr:hypothetical protein [Desulfobacterales bacterium]